MSEQSGQTDGEDVSRSDSDLPQIGDSQTEKTESDYKAERQHDVSHKHSTSTHTVKHTQFKRPMIGPARKSGSNLSGSDRFKSKTGETSRAETDVKTKDDNIPASDGDIVMGTGEELTTLDEIGDLEQKSDASETSKDISLMSEKPEISKLPPAKHLRQPQQVIPYLEPKWGGRTTLNYSMEIIKNGTVVQTLDLTDKSFYVFGRLPACDVPMDHPSLSRFHAVLQHCAVPNDWHEVGWYLFDLETTHGTRINKLCVTPKVYYRVRVGDVLKFAASSRVHILHGPEVDREETSELSVTNSKHSVNKTEYLTDVVKCQDDHSHKSKDTEFKRPMIGPARKSNNNLAGGSQFKSEKAITTTKHETEVNVKSDIAASAGNISGGTGEEQTSLDDTKKETCDRDTKSETLETSKSEDMILMSEKPENSKLPPAEQLEQPLQALPYLEPKWGGRTTLNYSMEIIKNGTVVQTLDLTDKSFYVFGRLPACDVPMDHPSLSRFHAVLQHCSVPNDRHEVGWYLFDLETTHGTRINKLQVNPRMYYRVRVGHVLKFAGSSRLHILQGPADDQEKESGLSITEMKEQREQRKREEELAKKLTEEEPEEEPDQGCTWGMSDDAHVDPESTENPFADAIPQNEELYLDDPKKTLKGFFEREGYDLPEYQFEEAGHGKHKCIVEVPVDSPTGQAVYAEAIVTGKRKDAVVACALEACRILDRYGLLRKKDHEAKKVKLRSWEDNDYYNSDEDEFLDRTGEIQKKRELRMKRAGKFTDVTETYDSLTTKLAAVDVEIQDIDKQLEVAKKDAVTTDVADIDALDAYMLSIKKGGIDTKMRMALKRRLFDLKKERGRLERLVDISKPALMPHTVKSNLGNTRGRIGGRLRFGQMHGHIGGRTKKTGSSIPDQQVMLTASQATPEMEEEASSPGTPGNVMAISSTKDSTWTEQTTPLEQMEPPEHAAPSEQMAPFLDATNLHMTTTCSENEAMPEQTISNPTGITLQASAEQTTKPQQTPEMTETETVKHTTDSDLKPSDDVSTDRLQQVQDVSGPAMRTQCTPDADAMSQGADDDSPQVKACPLAVKKRNAEAKKANVKKMKSATLSGDYCTDDPDFAVWMPPEGQTGDGKTHLNAKFGY